MRWLFSNLLTRMRRFRLAHCGGIRFAPSRVDVITHSELAVFNARFYIRVRSFDEPS
jgi:hypothetical protein